MKIGCVYSKYHYGDPARGASLEAKAFYPALQQITDQASVLWIDEFLDKKDELQQRIFDFASAEEPQLLFFTLMNDELAVRTLEDLKKLTTTINWFCDDYWRFDTFTQKVAPHFHYAVTTDKYYLKEYERIGYSNVVLSQWAAFDVAEPKELDRRDFLYDISFVGINSDYRQWLSQQLKRRGYRIQCFGYGWESGPVTYEQMAEICSRSRINLNMSNSVCYDMRCLATSPRSLTRTLGSLVCKGKKTAESVKARNFEIPAFGGFQLTPYVPGLEDFYEIGREIAVYTSLDDLLRQIDYYTAHEDERLEIVRRGYERTVRDHRYTDRFQNIIEHVQLCHA